MATLKGTDAQIITMLTLMAGTAQRGEPVRLRDDRNADESVERLAAAEAKRERKNAKRKARAEQER